jgi:hypothetical protein
MKKFLITTGIIGGLGIIGYSIYNFYVKQFNLLKQFTFKVTGFNLGAMTETLVNGSIKFNFCSISDIEILVEQFYLDFYVDGKKVGYITDTSGATGMLIPANSCNELSFDFSLNPQLIFGNIADITLLVLKQKDVMITLQGSVQLKSGFIQTTVPLKFTCSMQKMDCGS